MNKSDALRKIQKCMALATSSEPHEAARAMQQAQALMREFDVEHPELQAQGASSEWVRSRASSRPPSYETWLANLVSDAFGAELLWERKIEGWNIVGGYTFVGAGASAEVAAYSFAVLSRKLRTARVEYTVRHLKRYRRNKVAAADRFCEGWVLGIGEAVLPCPPKPEQRLAIASFLDVNYPDVKEGGLKTSRRDLANESSSVRHLHQGWDVGSREKLHSGIGSDGQNSLALEHQ